MLLPEDLAWEIEQQWARDGLLATDRRYAESAAKLIRGRHNMVTGTITILLKRDPKDKETRKLSFGFIGSPEKAVITGDGVFEFKYWGKIFRIPYQAVEGSVVEIHTLPSGEPGP